MAHIQSSEVAPRRQLVTAPRERDRRDAKECLRYQISPENNDAGTATGQKRRTLVEGSASSLDMTSISVVQALHSPTRHRPLFAASWASIPMLSLPFQLSQHHPQQWYFQYPCYMSLSPLFLLALLPPLENPCQGTPHLPVHFPCLRLQ